jgi:hypothetical protein
VSDVHPRIGGEVAGSAPSTTAAMGYLTEPAV